MDKSCIEMIEIDFLQYTRFTNDPSPVCLGCTVEFLLSWQLGKNFLRFKIAVHDVHIFEQETVINFVQMPCIFTLKIVNDVHGFIKLPVM